MTESRRLLVLDDDPLVGMLIETVARLAGVPSRLTQTHGEFFEALVDWNPTHLVLDLTMPGMAGEEVLAELGRRACTARVVVASGVERERLDAALACGVDAGLEMAGVLPKPFLPAALRALLA